MVFSMPIPPKPPWHSTPTAIVSLPVAAPNCNSLIESPTDAPATEKCKNTSYDNIENDRPDDDDDDDGDCFPCQATQPVLQQEKQPWYSFYLPAITHNPTQAPRKPTPKRTLTKQSASRNNKNERPDDDNDNDNDVDCFPRQDKQPVPPQQDISPTDTLPSLIESTTDTPTAPMNFENNNNNNNNNNNDPSTTNTRSDTHASLHADAPLLVWDGTQYQLDYNHNHRPISTWNGTTHTDIVYDDYDCRTDYDYADGDSLNMNDPSVRLQFTKCLKTVQFNNYFQATPQASPQQQQQQQQPSKHTMTTITHTHKDSTLPPPPYKYDLLQLLFLTTHYDNTKDYVDEFQLYTVPQYITRKKHPSHDNYLYRRWNNPIVHKTKKTHKMNQRLPATAKDDTSRTSTLETLSTLDTRSSHQTNIDPDTILSITIWNHPIAQYRIPSRPNTHTRNRSREQPSTAVQYALIGIHDKLLHPRKSPLLYILTSIVCVVLSCFILLADSFTMVKIDDRYPDEWND